MNDMPPRIAPLEESQFTEEMRELLALPLGEYKQEGPVSEYLATLVRHPGLYRRYAAFAGKLLLGGKLPARDRELAIMRVGWLCRAPFEWGEHVAIARKIGITREEVERVTRGSSDPAWTAHERALLQAVEELHKDAMISDATWAVLAQSYDEKQQIELPMLIGDYQMIAYVQNSLRIRLRPENAGLAAR